MTAESAKIIPINPEAELEQETLTLYEQATSLIVSDAATYAAAGELGKGLKDLEKKIVDYFAPMKKAAHEAHKAITKKESDELAPVKEAMDVVRKTMNTFIQEQERIRREAERKARAEEEERARKEKERLEAQVLKALESGKDEKAESLLEKADNVYAAPVTVAPMVDRTLRTSSGNITQAKDIKVTVLQMIPFLQALCAQNPGAVANIVKIGDGPLKAFVKTNGIKSFPGLAIEETLGVRL